MNLITIEQSPLRANILSALRTFANQRPGLEYGNYGDRVSYQAEVRSITQSLHDARELIRAVELSGIDADQLIKAFDAFSGRLSIEVTGDKVTIDYCAGQYWQTEYRRAVCAVCASALWQHYRDDWKGDNAGEYLRLKFRTLFGKRIQQQYFH